MLAEQSMKVWVIYAVVVAFGAIVTPLVFGRYVDSYFKLYPSWFRLGLPIVAGATVMAVGLTAFVALLDAAPPGILPDPSTFKRADGCLCWSAAR